MVERVVDELELELDVVVVVEGELVVVDEEVAVELVVGSVVVELCWKYLGSVLLSAEIDYEASLGSNSSRTVVTSAVVVVVVVVSVVVGAALVVVVVSTARS